MAGSHRDDKDRAATRVTGAKPLDEIEREIAANTRAFVVGPYPQKRGVAADANLRSFAARLDEAVGLAAAIDLTVVEPVQVLLTALRPATYLGKGKVEELAERIKSEEISLVVMDCALSPVQQRNLEKAFGCKVIDRTGLILEIFGRRARTKEGALQVELAHLNYQKSRLVRSWTHLERQRGGFGFLGGPGETQIEADRRIIQERMTKIERDLDSVKRTRSLHRASRKRVPYPIVALVGYTNAGKSSLFNTLTGAGVFAENLLFATLDTTVRKLTLPHGREVVLSDTVGFVADLPTDLVAAFRATLEEVLDADVILHARDVANPDHPAQAMDVLKVLGELGVSAETTPIIEVWNKVDLVNEADLVGIVPASKVAGVVAASAKTGQGLDALKLAIEKALGEKSRTYHVHVPHTAGSDIGWLHSHSEIVARDEPTEEGSGFTVRVEPRHKAEFLERFNGRIESSDA